MRSLELESVLRAIPGATVARFGRELVLEQAAGEVFDHLAPREELLSRPFPSFFSPPVASVMDHELRRVLAGESRTFSVAGPGSTWEVAASPVDGGGLFVTWNTSAGDHGNGELSRRLAQQSAVARLGERALRHTTVDELAQAASRAAAEGLGIELAFVAHGGSVAAQTGLGEDAVGTPPELGPGVVTDLPAQPELDAPRLRALGAVSGIAVVLADTLLGAYARDRRAFSAHDLDFLHSLAHIVTSAIAQCQAAAQIRHDALHDALTGLPNRTLLLDRMTGALGRLRRGGWRVALLSIDVDRLKVINESLGHSAGDELLAAIGPRLNDVVRPGDTVAHFAGDGFKVLCEGIADEAHAARVAERIMAAFEAPFTLAGEERIVSVSVGIAVAACGQSPEELIANAESAMYRAKDCGRARAELHDAAQRARVGARLKLEDDLRRALAGDSDELWVAYQPIHRIGGGIAAVEALARWNHPEYGSIPPSDFVPIAEDCGLIASLGRRILREACRQVAHWRATTAVADLGLSVNVSTRQVTAPGLPQIVASALAESGLPAAALWIELTEGLLLEDSAGTVGTCEALRDLGVRLVLDDFGTGYSSLGYLRRYPIDVIKIDRSFIDDLGADGEGDAAIVAAIVGMARALGMATVPEGVETAAQLKRVGALACDYVQVFHLCRPLPASQLQARLAPGIREALPERPATKLGTESAVVA